MIILAIETSCDDTGVAIIEARNKGKPRFKIFSNLVSSQVKIHQKFGGVYPTLAKWEHQKNLLPLLVESLNQSGLLIKDQRSKIKNQKEETKFKTIKKILVREPFLFRSLKKFLKIYSRPKIDLIATTIGPGLEPCLWVGVNFAKALGYFWNLPLIPVNHIEAHIYANLIGVNSKFIFPTICLIVSGGHTQLILMSDFGKYKILGETRDDAAGECLDKVAKILGLGYPGGPIIAETAKKLKIGNEKLKISLPRPMIHQKNYDFSFSGLKTAVLYHFKNQPLKIRKSKKYIQEICKEVQQAIIDVLIYKTIRAAKEYRAKTIIIGGGVAANEELRKQFKEKIKKELSGLQYLKPAIQFSTDNAAMVAVAGYFGWLKSQKKNWSEIRANANLKMA